MNNKKLFEIDKDSEVVGTERGVVYVTTTPNHPGTKMKDHDKTYVAKHVVIMENSLGRILRKGEEVHHKDENPENNALSNLELISKAKHQRQHALKEKRWEKSKFWKKSPRTKPGQGRKVAQAFLARS
jgi:hypothetical protein